MDCDETIHVATAKEAAAKAIAASNGTIEVSPISGPRIDCVHHESGFSLTTQPSHADDPTGGNSEPDSNHAGINTRFIIA